MESATTHRNDPNTPIHISAHEIELIKFRDNRTPLIFKLLGDVEIQGAIRWFDERVIRIVKDDRSEVTVYHHAIAYYSQLPR